MPCTGASRVLREVLARPGPILNLSRRPPMTTQLGASGRFPAANDAPRSGGGDQHCKTAATGSAAVLANPAAAHRPIPAPGLTTHGRPAPWWATAPPSHGAQPAQAKNLSRRPPVAAHGAHRTSPSLAPGAEVGGGASHAQGRGHHFRSVPARRARGEKNLKPGAACQRRLGADLTSATLDPEERERSPPPPESGI